MKTLEKELDIIMQCELDLPEHREALLQANTRAAFRGVTREQQDIAQEDLIARYLTE